MNLPYISIPLICSMLAWFPGSPIMDSWGWGYINTFLSLCLSFICLSPSTSQTLLTSYSLSPPSLPPCIHLASLPPSFPPSEQESLKQKLVEEDREEVRSWRRGDDTLANLKYVAGVDISFIKESPNHACAMVTVLSFPHLKVGWSE